MTKISRALTIAGSDSGGGAGIQADIKTFEAFGVFGMSVVTAVTAQNTCEVRLAEVMNPKVVAEQIDAVYRDIGVDAAKTGMLANSAIINVVAEKIRRWNIPVVVDPVMVAKSGALLLERDAVRGLAEHLLPRTVLITPNAKEAEILAGCCIATWQEAKAAARKLAKKTRGVLLKGGHLHGNTIVDWLVIDGKTYEFAKERMTTRNTHGTGCTLSAAIAAHIALGVSLAEAVERSEIFIERAIRGALPLGHGHGPVNHRVEIQNEACRWTVLQEVRRAIELFEKENIADLIPEVGSNFVVALPFAQKLDEIAGVEGRIVKTTSGAQAAGGPWFGVSNHVARLLLGIRQYDPDIQAAMNIRYSPEVIGICKKLGLRIATFNRSMEPQYSRNQENQTLYWAVRRVMKRKIGAPDVVVDRGAVGKEPMIRLLAKDSRRLVEMALKIGRLKRSVGMLRRVEV